MANPRQRRKAKSGSRSLTPSKRTLNKRKKLRLGNLPSQLAKEYDSKRTVTQNFRAMGLLHRLDPKLAGGIESASPSTGVSEARDSIPAGLARVIRDEKGRIVDVVEGSAISVPQTPWGESLPDWTPAATATIPCQPSRQGIAYHATGDEHGLRSSLLPAAQALEKTRERFERQPKQARRASDLEIAWVRELYQAHGGDLIRVSLKRAGLID